MWTNRNKKCDMEVGNCRISLGDAQTFFSGPVEGVVSPSPEMPQL